MQLLANGAGLVAPSQRSIPEFRLHQPTTLAEAVEIAASESGNAVFHAGGTDLIVQLREGLIPDAVIALSRIDELRTVARIDDVLQIGAGLTHDAGSAHPLVRRSVPGLAAGWSQIATVRIRFTATVGGNLLARRARYEMSILLQSLDARLRFHRQGAQSTATVPEIWARSEASRGLLAAIEIPDVSAVKFDYDRSMRPVLTVALTLRHNGRYSTGHAVIGSEYRVPQSVEFGVDHHYGGRLGLRALAQQAAARFPDDIGDPVTSARYRRRVAAVLLERQLARLLEGKPQ